jgi:hypothetical protein
MATPSWSAQVVTTRVNLDQLAAKYPLQRFKVGRCAAASCEGEWGDPDCAKAERFVKLWRGSAADAARMQTDLVRHARRKHATRCRNGEAAPSATEPPEPHVVFVAFWPKSG